MANEMKEESRRETVCERARKRRQTNRERE